MNQPLHKKTFTAIALAALLIFFYLFPADITGKAAEDAPSNEHIISAPLPSATPTPGIQPLDDFPDKKNLT